MWGLIVVGILEDNVVIFLVDGQSMFVRILGSLLNGYCFVLDLMIDVCFYILEFDGVVVIGVSQEV